MNEWARTVYLEVNGCVAEARTLRELRRQLKAISFTDLSEVDLQADDEPKPTRRFFGLIVMISGARAFLTFFRYDGDPGLNSCDPSYTGPIDAELEFRFSNGEVDPYPVWWTIPTRHALRAVEYTYRHGEPAPFVTWREADEMSRF